MDSDSGGSKPRLVITFQAAPGRGADLAAALKIRALEVRAEPGCEQFDILQSVIDPDVLVMTELWSDQASLDAYGRVRASKPPAYAAELTPISVQRERYPFQIAR